MENKKISLKEISIKDLFLKEKNIYEIPIYQRNYAWEKDEINVFIQDVYDYFKKNNKYYIGTLVSYNKGNNVYEIIDGQQRLTTIRLILDALEVKKDEYKSYLTYRARNKSDETLKSIPDFNISNIDSGIRNGFKYAEASINEIVGNDEERLNFLEFFKSNVHIIHYQVPENIDLNHCFEIMNSRGEQLEQHEIVKARLMEVLQGEDDRAVFNNIWACCSEMNIYVQKKIDESFANIVFGDNLNKFKLDRFEALKENKLGNDNKANDNNSIMEILDMNEERLPKENEKKDLFLPIVDFPNFLLIVLKITLMNEGNPKELVLDDKELLKMFENAIGNHKDKGGEFVKRFSYNLLKARYFLDNYVVHHTMEDEKIGRNPWKLQVWNKNDEPSNLDQDKDLQDRLVHLLSMFEVTYSVKQRKNYLFYCLLYLMGEKGVDININNYAKFLERLAYIYFHEVYLSGKTFDDAVLDGNKLRDDVLPKYNKPKGKKRDEFSRFNGKGIPLFVFNYLDYKLWDLYAGMVKGKSENCDKKKFFEKIGCSNYGGELEVFRNFYFSRTRNSLEHYYPRANENDKVSEGVIECFGNYAMIGSEANSSGSNWNPETKRVHYLDSSGKINRVSVSSLKFRIMMQICKACGGWEKSQIDEHQEKMIEVLFDDCLILSKE